MAKKQHNKNTKAKFLLLFLLLGFAIWLTTSAPRAYDINIPKGYKIHGIDVSRYQEKIDWKNLETLKDGKHKIGVSFAFIKATEGRSIVDPMYSANWENISKTNIIRGAYHFFIPSRDAVEQAQNFIKTVNLKKGDLPPVLDIETLGNQGAAKLRENIKIWMDIVEKHYGVTPIIYTYVDFYEQYLIDDKELKKYPLWIAHYHKKKIKMREPWIFWQHSDKGVIKGIKEKVDFNVFNGSLKELKALCL